MNVLCIGFCVENDYFDKYTCSDLFPQVAAYKLESRFIRALIKGGAEVNRISSASISTYPGNKNIFLPSSKSLSNDKGANSTIALINLPLMKMITRFLGVLLTLIRTDTSRVSVLCVYSAHTPNLLAAYLFSLFKSKPFFVYIPDLPLYMDLGVKRSRFLKFLKGVDSKLITFLISKSSGIFVATKYMKSDNLFWISVPSIVIEGIADDTSPFFDYYPKELPKINGKKIIFYAGTVNKSYGIVELVEGFKLSNSSYELWICGRGDLEEYLKLESENNNKIKYLGFVAPKYVYALQQEASLLVLTRDPEEIYTRYSFPSKLMEYFLSGVPILATRLEGVPSEYYDYINVIEDFSIESITFSISYLDTLNNEKLLEKAKFAREWLLKNKTSDAVGKRIINFMEAACE